MLKILDLFCGCGGAAMGIYKSAQYHKVDVEITGYDIEPQKDYPFTFIQSDVSRLKKEDLADFDFVWASPPCQSFSTLKFSNPKCKAENYIPFVRKLIKHKPAVIENVALSPLRNDLILTGDMFGFPVIRKRIFEIYNFFCFALPEGRKVKNYIAVYGFGKKGQGIKDWQKAMDIDWTKNRKSLANAVPPYYSQYIFDNYLCNK